MEDIRQPVGELSIIALHGCENFVSRVDNYIREWRGSDKSYITSVSLPRFGNGEGKGIVNETVRGHDIYIICDIANYGVTYKMFGREVPMSPDDHFQDLKRVLGACAGKQRRTTVIMPMLYEGRQHRRAARESLDCAIALQELVAMGVTNIITCDAHDTRVQNAIPNHGFDSVQPVYQMLKALVHTVPDIDFSHGNTVVISPDEGAISRAMYYATMIGVDLGTFYKRRDYSVVVNGSNPIVAHEFLGNDIAGKDAIVVDDMISSGSSMLDVCYQLKARGAKRIFVFSTFGLFCNGFERFDEAYASNLFDRIFTTNVIYIPDELAQREWYTPVDMTKLIALLVDTMNCDSSISSLLSPTEKINKLLGRMK